MEASCFYSNASGAVEGSKAAGLVGEHDYVLLISSGAAALSGCDGTAEKNSVNVAEKKFASPIPQDLSSCAARPPLPVPCRMKVCPKPR